MKKRLLVRALEALASELDYRLESYSHDWILRLHQGERCWSVVNHVFPLNSAATHLLLKDKTGVSLLLEAAGVPCVPHRLVNCPRHAEKMGLAPEEQINAIQQEFGFPLVLKPNQGMAGRDVSAVYDQTELTTQLTKLWETERAVTLSPCLDSSHEIRVVLLDGRALLIFQKYWPQTQPGFQPFNLSQGARAALLTDPAEKSAAIALAQQAAQTLDIQLACIDLLATPDGLKILEINGGIYLEQFAAQVDESRAYGVYREIMRFLLQA